MHCLEEICTVLNKYPYSTMKLDHIVTLEYVSPSDLQNSPHGCRMPLKLYTASS